MNKWQETDDTLETSPCLPSLFPFCPFPSSKARFLFEYTFWLQNVDFLLSEPDLDLCTFLCQRALESPSKHFTTAFTKAAVGLTDVFLVSHDDSAQPNVALVSGHAPSYAWPTTSAVYHWRAADTTDQQRPHPVTMGHVWGKWNGLLEAGARYCSSSKCLGEDPAKIKKNGVQAS